MYTDTNDRSIRNKTDSIVDFITDLDCDLFTIAETYFTDNVSFTSVVSPPGYKFIHISRYRNSRGGVGLIYRENLEVKINQTLSFKSFEMRFWMSVGFFGSNSLRFTVVHRPPPSNTNKLRNAMFL